MNPEARCDATEWVRSTLSRALTSISVTALRYQREHKRSCTFRQTCCSVHVMWAPEKSGHTVLLVLEPRCNRIHEAKMASETDLACSTV